MGRKHHAQALADFSQVIKFNPNYAAALDSRAVCYLALGHLDAAIADFAAALKLNPLLASSLYGRGLALRKKGDDAAENDIAAAKAIKADIADEFSQYGVE